MKKKIMMALVLVMMSITATRACDICGCGVGSYYLGILPEYNKRFIGLRYQHKTLITHLGPFGERTPLTSEETYQSMELWGGWNIGSRFRVLAFVPYNFNERESQTGNGTKNGLGDIALMGYYKLFDDKGTLGDRLLVQSLWVGGGIKVPTGKYEPSERLAVSESPNNFQLGTASTDFTLNAAYDIRYNDLGLNANVNYKINTENKYAYRYGNKFTGNILMYYKIRVANSVTLAPNAGVLYETAQKDIENKKYDVAVSGGYSLSAVGGVEVSLKRLSLGANYQNVRSQDLAGGRVHAGNRLMVHMSLPF
ncbi:transporter [Pedobacter nutrimenti]|uniref:transporter n=1 Tax=Pedobacter nutrimenti TaxID=1241337 RepID=UPI002930E74A|nr:transporter [Pedobacter nutrimenti]